MRFFCVGGNTRRSNASSFQTKVFTCSTLNSTAKKELGQHIQVSNQRRTARTPQFVAQAEPVENWRCEEQLVVRQCVLELRRVPLLGLVIARRTVIIIIAAICAFCASDRWQLIVRVDFLKRACKQ